LTAEVSNDAARKDGTRRQAGRPCADLGYGRENNGWLVTVLDPLRRLLFSRLPIGMTHHLSLYPAILVWLLVQLGLQPIEYFRFIAKFDFAHLRAIVFDQMLPRIAHCWPREVVAR
jgi:hypothetical protein